MADIFALALKHDEQTALVAVDLALSAGVAAKTNAHGDQAPGAELRVETPEHPLIAGRPSSLVWVSASQKLQIEFASLQDQDAKHRHVIIGRSAASGPVGPRHGALQLRPVSLGAHQSVDPFEVVALR